MTKTAVLSGTEVEVSDLGGQNVAVKNLGDSAIYASPYPNVVAGADNVVEIPAGGGEVVLDAQGTVYLLGTGKAQCTGTSYATPNFKMPSSSSGTGGGGGKSQGVICGAAIIRSYPADDMQSILIEPSSEGLEKAFASALAEETGWELQSDGASVIKDGEVGFLFAPSTSGTMNYVCLINDVRNAQAGGYLDNLQYLEHTGSQYYMDIFRSPSGAVAFGFRRTNDNPNIAFIMTKDSAGNNVCMTTYSGSSQKLEWAKKGDTTIRKIDTTARAHAPGTGTDIIMGAFKCMDIYTGETIEDCYCAYTTWETYNGYLYPGARIAIDGKEFVIVCNNRYTIQEQAWIAMAIN